MESIPFPLQKHAESQLKDYNLHILDCENLKAHAFSMFLI